MYPVSRAIYPCWFSALLVMRVVILSVFIMCSAIGCRPSQKSGRSGPAEPNQARTKLRHREPDVAEAEPNVIDREPVISEPNISEPEVTVTDINVSEPNMTETEASVAEPNVSEANIPDSGLRGPGTADVNVLEVNVAEANVPPMEAAEVNVGEVNRGRGPNESFYEEWAEVLKTYVTGGGKVKYGLLNHRKGRVEEVLSRFSEVQREEYNSWPEEDKLAMWINVYNIQMLRVILDNYPIDSKWINRFFYWPTSSIRHIKPVNVIGVKKWDRYKLIVMDEEFTLSEIENDVLREEFDEPRVFFALTHATLSGPPLRDEPYYGDILYRQLDDQVKRFLATPKAFKIDREKREVHLSAMFDPKWYGQVFSGKYATDKRFKRHSRTMRAVLNFITRYLPEDKGVFLEEHTVTVRYINYDWRLNDASRR